MLSQASSKAQHNHWLQIEVKQLVVPHNQQADRDCDIKSQVSKRPYSRLNHTLDWLVAVILWCRNVKPTIYESRSASLTVINNLLKQNCSFNAFILPLFDMILLIPSKIDWTINLVPLNYLHHLPIMMLIISNYWKINSKINDSITKKLWVRLVF